jgi:hypothetical protein
MPRINSKKRKDFMYKNKSLSKIIFASLFLFLSVSTSDAAKFKIKLKVGDIAYDPKNPLKECNNLSELSWRSKYRFKNGKIIYKRNNQPTPLTQPIKSTFWINNNQSKTITLDKAEKNDNVTVEKITIYGETKSEKCTKGGIFFSWKKETDWLNSPISQEFNTQIKSGKEFTIYFEDKKFMWNIKI